jgi:DNA-binding MarR family transcriptional regulator
MLVDETVEQVYEYIFSYCRDNQYPPTYTEIAKGCGVTLSKVRRCLDVLEARGRITREFNAKRTIRVVSRGQFS